MARLRAAQQEEGLRGHQYERDNICAQCGGELRSGKDGHHHVYRISWEGMPEPVCCGCGVKLAGLGGCPVDAQGDRKTFPRIAEKELLEMAKGKTTTTAAQRGGKGKASETEKVARRAAKPPVGITDRNLKPGTVLVARYKKEDFQAKVVEGGEKGKVVYKLPDGRVFTSPSAAGSAITEKACNGWVFWNVRDGATAKSASKPKAAEAKAAAGTKAKKSGKAKAKAKAKPDENIFEA